MTTLATPKAQAKIPRVGGGPGRRRAASLTIAGVLGFFAAAAIVAFATLDFSGVRFQKSITSAQRFFARMFPLDFSEPGELLRLTVLTLAIVICGTVLSAIISVPVAYWAARNTSPHPSLQWIGRATTVLARAFPELILIIILATMFSLGSLPGILAIGLHSVGMVAKLFADAIEQIDEGPRTAIRAAGGTKMQQFVSGILPQVTPSWIATILHRNDINLRASAILGYVGMPGLGYELSASIQRLDYKRAMAVALLLFLLCAVMEIVSAFIRRMVLNSGHTASATPTSWERARGALMGWTAVTVIAASACIAQPNWGDFLTIWAVLPERIAYFFPFSTGEYTWPQAFAMLWDTTAIALAGTLIGVVFSIIIGSLAARNVAASSPARTGARLLLLMVRGIPELILAIVLILVTGLGGSAAALALGIGTVGLLGKLLADSIEEVDPGPERALKAVGASRPQVYFSSTMPQASPAFIGHMFYALDTNVRAATVLAVVGAGGVGQAMFNAAQLSKYNVVATFTLLVIAVVLSIEGLAVLLRKLLSY